MGEGMQKKDGDIMKREKEEQHGDKRNDGMKASQKDKDKKRENVKKKQRNRQIKRQRRIEGETEKGGNVR